MVTTAGSWLDFESCCHVWVSNFLQLPVVFVCSQILGSAINNVHEDCPDEQLIIGAKCADLAEKMAEAIAGRVEQLVRMLCNKVKRGFWRLLSAVVVGEVMDGIGR